MPTTPDTVKFWQYSTGKFTNKETGLWFDYAPLDAFPNLDNYEWAKKNGATHWVNCGNRETIEHIRSARVLKTVAYVGVDESPEGGIVWEKWDISKNRTWESNRGICHE